MKVLMRVDSFWGKLAMKMPYCIVPYIDSARVGYDCHSFINVHFFTFKG